MRKMLITGGRGMLASDLAKSMQAESGWEIHALSRSEMDVTDAAQVRRAVEGIRPDVVVHTAVLHVDAAEDDPEKAYLLNAWATRLLARACDRVGATLVYISTCGLFGHEQKGYTEYDPVILKTVYARSKYEGEVYVNQHCERHYIVRPGWLFGGSISHAKNFVVKRYEEAKSKTDVSSACDKFGTPTYTGDLARGISSLLETGEYGVYHVANGGAASRVEYVRHIIECFGLKTNVSEVESSHFPRKANVPDCEVLDCLNMRYVGLPGLPDWREAIAAYIGEIRADIGA